MFHPAAPDAPGRAKRAFDEGGLKGLCLFPAMHRFSVQDEMLEPIYRAAAERSGVVVFVHIDTEMFADGVLDDVVLQVLDASTISFNSSR